DEKGKENGLVVLRQRPPRATVPRWPRGLELVVLLLFAIGLVLVPFLVVIWGVPALERPGATAVSAYRADRRTTVIYGLACAPVGAFLGILVLAPAYGSACWLAGTLLLALGAAALCWIMGGTSYSVLKLTELVLAAKWCDRVGFLHLLEDAANRGIVRHAGAGYEFRDDALRAHLAALGQAALAGHRQEQARRPARSLAWSQRVDPARHQLKTQTAEVLVG